MPKKIRELKSLLLLAGFTYPSGSPVPYGGRQAARTCRTVHRKGSHTIWKHPLLPGEPITVAGKDGDDAKLYLEKEVNQKLKKLEDLL